MFNAERGARELNKAMSSANSDNIYYVYFKLPSVPEGAAAAALERLPHRKLQTWVEFGKNHFNQALDTLINVAANVTPFTSSYN